MSEDDLIADALPDLDDAIRELQHKRVGKPKFVTKHAWLIARAPVSCIKAIDYAAFAEDVEFMLDHHESIERMCERLDVSIHTLRRRLDRGGRRDLNERLNEVRAA